MIQADTIKCFSSASSRVTFSINQSFTVKREVSHRRPT